MSLYDRFKAINENVKIQAQIEILNVIQKYTAEPQSAYCNYESTRRQYDEQFHGYTTFSYDSVPRQHPSTSHSQYRGQFQAPASAIGNTYQTNNQQTTSNYQQTKPVLSTDKNVIINSPESVSTQYTDDDSIMDSVFN